MSLSTTIAAAAAAGCAALLAALFSGALRRHRIEKRLTRQSAADTSDAGAALRFSGARLARRLIKQKDYEAIEHELMKAGFWQPWQADAFVLVRALALTAGVVIGLIYLCLTSLPVAAHALDWLLWLFVLFLLSRAPYWLLTELAKKRQKRIRLFVPKAIDLLTLALNCGISLENALERVAHAIAARAPEVAREFELTHHEMLIIDRTSALKRLEARSGVHEMAMLAAALRQSIQFGIPLADTLKTIAEEARRAQMAELDEKAGKISADIGVPLILLILFPVIVLIAAPAVLQLMAVF